MTRVKRNESGGLYDVRRPQLNRSHMTKRHCGWMLASWAPVHISELWVLKEHQQSTFLFNIKSLVFLFGLSLVCWVYLNPSKHFDSAKSNKKIVNFLNKCLKIMLRKKAELQNAAAPLPATCVMSLRIHGGRYVAGITFWQTLQEWVK